MTGFFTVPPGRGGLYYILVYLDTRKGNYGRFFVAKFPKSVLCAVDGDNTDDPDDHDLVTCAVTLYLNPGKSVTLTDIHLKV